LGPPLSVSFPFLDIWLRDWLLEEKE